MERKTSRKLSVEQYRKLSAISNCSDVSNLSFKLGMDPKDFKSTIQNILDLDVGEGWTLDSDDEELGGGMSCYGEDDAPPSLSEETAAAASSNKETVTLHVDRKTSTGSTVSTDSLDGAEDFTPVQIDLSSVKSALNMYQKHKKISMSKICKSIPEK